MYKFQQLIAAIGVACLLTVMTGCERTPPPRDTTVPAVAGVKAATSDDCNQEAWHEGTLFSGQEIYQRVCASCHEGGDDNVPVTGDRDAWTKRSLLWSAVLLVHAREGYLDMPAKGGQLELTDGDVEAAGEYMLCRTFPELPRG